MHQPHAPHRLEAREALLRHLVADHAYARELIEDANRVFLVGAHTRAHEWHEPRPLQRPVRWR
jgi:hypothetical protein